MAARWQWLLCFALSLWPTAAGKRAPPGDIIHRGTGTGLEGAERPTDVHGRDIEMYERQSTIHQAAHMGDHERVRALMEAGISANTYDAAGLSPLHLSASAGHYMVSWLLLATPWDTSDDYPIRRESVELIPPVADTAAGFDPSDDREVLGWVYVDEEGREHGRSHELRGQTIEFDEDGRRISTVRSVIRKASSVDTGVDGDGDDGEGGGSWRGGARAELNSRALNVSNAFGDVQRHRFVTIQGETPMHYAARFGHTEIVDLFLSNVSGQVSLKNKTVEGTHTPTSTAPSRPPHTLARTKRR
jgi:ankyrin repeat protein